jgi:hypothetical protein
MRLGVVVVRLEAFALARSTKALRRPARPLSSVALWGKWLVWCRVAPSPLHCLLSLGCLGERAARCFVAQGVPVERGVADWEVTGSRTHAWEWQAHACVASRLPRAEQA